MTKPYDSKKVRNARLGAGYTQSELAQMVGLTVGIVSRVETGRNQSPKTIRKIAEALHVQVKELMSEQQT